MYKSQITCDHNSRTFFVQALCVGADIFQFGRACSVNDSTYGGYN